MENDEKKWVADIFDPAKIKKGEFNLLTTGCGTGKSWFVANRLLELYPDVKKEEIILVTSRSMTVDQQSLDKNIQKFNTCDKEMVDFWNDPELQEVYRKGIQIMTYDKIIYMLTWGNNINAPTFSGAKIIIFDECHTIFCDAGFIRGMNMIPIIIKSILDRNDTVVIGMTATPNILFEYNEPCGIKINKLNDEGLVRYKAGKMIVTDFTSIPQLLASGRFVGRTMIMCTSVKKCLELKKYIPNSAILVGKQSEHKISISDEINSRKIRTVIASENRLPDVYVDEKYKEHPLQVVICTTTAREGFSLKDADSENRVRNIICCVPDDISVVQFAGRARYDLDVLVVADPVKRADLLDNNSQYSGKQKEEFHDFVTGRNDGSGWFANVSHVVRGSFADVEVYHSSVVRGVAEFTKYIDRKWLTSGADGAEEKYIYKDKDKEEILLMAKKYEVSRKAPSTLTFNAVVKLLQNELGYTVENKQKRIGGVPTKYKVITKRCE